MHIDHVAKEAELLLNFDWYLLHGYSVPALNSTDFSKNWSATASYILFLSDDKVENKPKICEKQICWYFFTALVYFQARTLHCLNVELDMTRSLHNDASLATRLSDAEDRSKVIETKVSVTLVDCSQHSSIANNIGKASGFSVAMWASDLVLYFSTFSVEIRHKRAYVWYIVMHIFTET